MPDNKTRKPALAGRPAFTKLRSARTKPPRSAPTERHGRPGPQNVPRPQTNFRPRGR